ncbi:MAG TPA: ABC transporter permease [Acidimicrobiales bacterium]|nr:ABC transporter permease [Acidimicrobiales bacterium]
MDPDHGVSTLEPAKSGGAKSLRSSALNHRWGTAFLLTPPLLWFFVLYVSSLILMLITAFWSLNGFTGNVTHQFTGANFHQIATGSYPAIIGRTVLLAALVTVTDAIIAFPFAYVMARVATQRTQRLLLVAVLLPLWASYLAKIYAWISILERGGALNWTFQHLGLPSPNLGFTNGAMWLTFSYIWLPYMIVPLFGALERIPGSLLDASSDLGASSWWTLRHVIVPLALPGLVAGSIFTFSLTLGDYVTPLLVGGANSTLIGNAIYQNLLDGGNLPLAAALSTVPIVIMVAYLLVAKRFGAFESL